MQQLLDWLAGLPSAALYGALAVVAGMENVFPPVPADTVVAFGSYLAARTDRSVVSVFLAVWVGNVAGAMLMYWLGRRYGAERLAARMGGGDASAAKARLDALYGRFGIVALFVSRFLPGIRGFVPPLAGAARIPAVRTGVVMAAASAIWYGSIAYLAYRIGDDWSAISRAAVASGRWIGGAAMAVAVLAAAAWLLVRRRRRA